MAHDDAQQKTKSYACSYSHDRARWPVTIHAYDWEDAEARCRKLGLNLDGELVATVPVQVGLLAKLACAVRNFIFIVKQHSEAPQSSRRDP